MVKLAPAAQIRVDARVMQDWRKLTRECREIRGSVLAKCFEIEYLLDHVISHALFPGTSDEEREVFDELFLKGSGSSFRNKIEVLRKLRVKLPGLTAYVPESLASLLDSLREVRNDFAHYPISFVPVGDPPNQNLEPSIASKRGTFTLNAAFLDKWGGAFAEALSGLEAVSKALNAHVEAKPGALPNGDLATPGAGSGATEGPPSVS